MIGVASNCISRRLLENEKLAATRWQHDLLQCDDLLNLMIYKDMALNAS